MAEVEPASVIERGGSGVRSRELTIAEQERVRAMQRLAKASDRPTYLALQREIAEQLGMTVRNVQYEMSTMPTSPRRLTFPMTNSKSN